MSPTPALLDVTCRCYYWLIVRVTIWITPPSVTHVMEFWHICIIDFVFVQNFLNKLKNHCSSFRFYSPKLLLWMRVVLDCVHKATDNQMVIPVGSALSMQPMPPPPPWLPLDSKKYDALFAFNWWGAIHICKCSIISRPYGTGLDTSEGMSKILAEIIAVIAVKNILCGGREEGVCFWSTLPPLISDTLVTGLAEHTVVLGQDSWQTTSTNVV